MASSTGSAGYYDSFDRQKLNPGDPEEFKSRMLDFVRSNRVAADALIAGNVQMFGFENMKEQLGGRWEKARDKVLLLTESIIKKIISSHDVYIQISDEQFIVLFGRDTKEQADVKAAQIAREVNRRLTGIGAEGEAITVKTLVLELPRDDDEALITPRKIIRTVEEAQRDAEERDRELFARMESELAVGYWPVANVRKRLVSMYRIRIEGPAGPLLAQRSETGALEAARDVFALRRGGEALTAALAAKNRALLVVPVCFDTLNARQFRIAYLEACHGLPQVAAKRMLLLVEGLPDGVPQSKLHTMFSYVGPFFAGFIGDFALDFLRGPQMGGVKMIGVATDGTGIAELTPGVRMDMAKFAKENAKGKMRTFFTGATDLEMATAARRARFDFVQGAGVAPAMHVFGKTFSIS